jgi:hypothetical protein
MNLAGRLEAGEEVRLTMVVTATKRNWAVNVKEVRVTYRADIVEMLV